MAHLRSNASRVADFKRPKVAGAHDFIKVWAEELEGHADVAIVLKVPQEPNAPILPLQLQQH